METYREEVHGRGDYQFPQLELLRPDLAGLPEVELPEGYAIRHYAPGDEAAWSEIMSEAFTPYWTVERFKTFFLPHFGFDPERLLFICHRGTPVGSASAFLWPGVKKSTGYIHMVGIKKSHCGMGLGYYLTARVLETMREKGFQKAMLQTEDFRIPAIKHYIRLGFRPVLISEKQREKWRDILAQIGGPEMVDSLELDNLPVKNRISFYIRTARVGSYVKKLNTPGG